ncbi:MAG: phosphoribosyltransferase [Acidocella sp. 20-57-95]|nr:MAG: phosphoribosyltransferase [Acidocella sp. 20-57-95]OYV57366.1 MAG: phosphoribosyltransferase [Acidocella sp. 21-58-7]HQT64456.1 ComF family protein [Acidocella sp.]HQU05532.1 ComF family protein [Acidocella sp.]
MTFFTLLKPLGRSVLDTLLPPNCLACDTPVDSDGQFCLPCFRTVNFISSPICGCCGVPLPFGAAVGQGGICSVCEAMPPAFSTARAALRYDDAAKRLILPFKYADRTEAAGGLAVLMLKAGAALLARADVLVPVPLHISRLRQRRYNQAALLANAIGRMARKPVIPDALVRRRATVPLGPLGFEARRLALQDSIAVRTKQLGGKHILLIDDVMTSGATAHECARILLLAGALRVDVLTAARVPDPRLS